SGTVFVQQRSFFYYSTDYGSHWTVTTPFSEPCEYACLCGDSSGNVYSALISYCIDGSCQSILFQAYHDGGVTWLSKPHIVDTLADPAFVPSMACDEMGHVCIAWRNIGGDGMRHVYVTVSDSYGETFAPAVQIDTAGDNYTQNPSVALDCLGHVYVAWAGIPL